MSHTVQVKDIRVTDEAALRAACDALGVKVSAKGQHSLYGGNVAEGIAVDLPGWRLPVVIDTKTGEARYDNYNEHWGKQVELDKLIQRYSIETLRTQAMLQGMTCTEEPLDDGAVKLSLVNYA